MPTTTPTTWLAPFKINSTDTGPDDNDQSMPQVIALTGGRFFVAWSDNTNIVGIGAPDIYGRFVGPAGAFTGGPLGGNDFLLNGFIDFQQGPPAIAARPDGGFNLVYQTTTDPIFNLGEGVPIDRFDTNGTPLANPGLPWINSAADETAPAIASFSDGSSVIVFELNTDLHFRILSPAGVIGPDLNVSLDPGNQTDAQVAALTPSSFVTAFVTDNAGTHDISFAVRQTDGTLIAGGTAASGVAEQTDPSITALAGGGFALTWTDSASDGSGTAIRARLYTSAGLPLPAMPAAFGVNTSTAGDQKTPSIAALADGGFVVVWDDDGAQQIRGQRFNANGTAVGVQFTVAAMGDASSPDVALLDDGRFVVSFANIAASNSDIYTAIFDPRDSLINATAGNDVFTSRIDGATVNGLGGDDTLLGQAAADTLNGGTGSDTLSGGAGGDFLYGGDDNDIVEGGLGNDRIDGGLGSDTIDYSAAGSALYIDLRVATQANTGGLGTDVISAVESVIGGAFADVLIGNAGANTLYGGAGADALVTVEGDDFAYGGTGDDYLAGRDGNDTLFGGDNNDVIDGAAGIDVLRGNAGDDFLIGGADNDTIYGGDGGANIGDIGDRWLGGDAGNDSIFGNLGADRLSGGADNDFLTGGEGFDYMTGEAGIDTFIYNALSEGSISEQIGDWQGGIDKLQIDASAFGGGLAAGALAANRLVIGTVANQAFGQFLYNSANGVLSWDADGTGAGAAVAFTRLFTTAFTLPPATLAATDFLLVA